MRGKAGELITSALKIIPNPLSLARASWASPQPPDPPEWVGRGAIAIAYLSFLTGVQQLLHPNDETLDI